MEEAHRRTQQQDSLPHHSLHVSPLHCTKGMSVADHVNRYMGGSIPGKIYEPVCYSGGIPAYKIEIREALDTMKGFEVVKNK